MILCGLAVLTVASFTTVRADETATQLQSLMEKRAPAIVTVTVVLKTQASAEGQGEESESRLELQGVVVDKDGLIMVTSAAWSPDRLMEMMGREEEGSDSGVKIVPTGIKVIFERDDKEFTAFLAATDTKLGLSFLQIADKLDHPLPTVDFSAAGSPALGEQVVSVSRMPKGFDYAPFFDSARISGVIAKPRKAWMLDGGLGGVGLPVFTLKDEVVGVLTMVPAGVSDAASTASLRFSMFMRGISGGSGPLRAYIVPGPAIAAVLTQAKKRAADMVALRAQHKAAGTSPVAPKALAKPGAPAK
jgi:hypothetical protein